MTQNTTHTGRRFDPRALFALAGALVALGGCGSDEPDDPTPLTKAERIAQAPARFDAAGLLPSFDPAQRFYVTRCDSGVRPVQVRAKPGAEVVVDGLEVRGGTSRVPVFAQPGKDFSIDITSGEDQTSYSVRCLPRGFPVWKFRALRPSQPSMFVVAFPLNQWVVVFDNEGVPRWWWRSAPFPPIGAEFTEDETVTWSRSFGDGYGRNPRQAHEVHGLDGRLVRLIRTHGGPVIDAHEDYRLPNGDRYLDSYNPRYPYDFSEYGGPRRGVAMMPEIEQIDEEGKLVWSWLPGDQITFQEIGRWWPNIIAAGKPAAVPPGSPAAGLTAYDWFHINTIEPWGEQVLISGRHADAVYGLDRASGRILWKLGGATTPESLTAEGDEYDATFGGQHDARMVGDDVLSVFDNRTHYPEQPRAVFWKLDLEEKKATFLRSFKDPRVPSGVSGCCGSVRRIAGGWLVGWGGTPWVTGFDDEGRIMFRFRTPGESYRAAPLPPEVTVEDLNRGLEQMEASGVR